MRKPASSALERNVGCIFRRNASTRTPDGVIRDERQQRPKRGAKAIYAKAMPDKTAAYMQPEPASTKPCHIAFWNGKLRHRKNTTPTV